MKDTSGTKEELIEEISDLKKKVKKLEKWAAQHKQMEDALRESELKYRSLIEFSSDAIFCVDEKGQYKFTNSLFASTFGKTPDYFIGKTFWDIYPKEHADQRYEVTKRVFATGRSESLEVEVPLPDKTLYFYATADPIHDEAGKVILTLTHAVDITDRKQAEAKTETTLAALRESEASLEEAQRIARIGSWEWDMISNTVKWSKEMYRVFGISPDAFDGKPESLLKVIHPDDVDLFTNTMKSNLSKGDPTSLEFRVIHKSGSIHHVFAAGRVEYNKNGRPIRNIGTAQDITELKQAEEELQDTHWRLESIIEGTNVGTWEWNVQTGATVFNDVWAQIIGYTLDELKPISIKTWEKYSHPDDLKQSVKLLERHFAGELPYYDFDCRMKHKDGHWVWVQDRGRVITHTTDGKPLLMFGTHTNITERKQSDEKLRENEKYYRSLVEGMPGIVYTFSKKSGGVYYSSNAASILGYSPEQLYAQPQLWHNSIHPDDLSHVEKIIRETVTGKPFCVEYRIRDAQGNWHWFEDRSFGYKMDGEDTIIEGLAFDITDRKQASEVLREKELQYNHMADAGLALIWTSGTDKLCNYFNLPWLKFTGRTLEQEMGNGWVEGVHPEDLDRCVHTYVTAFDKHEAFDMDYRLRHASGEYRWIRDLGTPNYDGTGAFIGYIGHCFDITDRIQAEEEKSKLKNQLFQSQKMEAIGTLAGGIAHDFNNILSVIIGYTELARDRNQKENKEQYLQEVLMGAERARNLVKQILTFSRQDDHEKKPLDIKVLLKEAIKFLRASIPSTIEIEQHITGEDCTIMADPTQMHQVIMNLCTNASHAMKEAGGTLKIELGKETTPNHPELQPGHYVKLTVSDTGHGIDPALIQRVFDPFFTTKSKDEGTGLGLSVVYGIVKGHGGVVNVYSKPGKGATFHVYLPFIIQTEAKELDAGKPVIGGTERILFVDDEPSLVDIGMRMLFPLGYHVTGATSSKEALDIFRAEPQRFDLVITDMTLPKMTGIDLSRMLLQIRPDIPIILCSGIKEEETEAKAKSMGVKAYLTKPLTRRELAGVMREVLGKKAED